MDICEGTNYRLMRRLQQEARVQTYLVESASGPSRKYYRLTTAGHAALAAMRDAWRSFVDEVEAVMFVPDASGCIAMTQRAFLQQPAAALAGMALGQAFGLLLWLLRAAVHLLRAAIQAQLRTMQATP
ncbi:MAG TPA: PadR family transcriptional regulator [Chitinolyticbacter sp.]|nr:PadR family transcriptional regulator [Chitinolyticbacter sp.]